MSPKQLSIHDLHIEGQTINLNIAPGEVVCLMGPSGCGKTRTLRALADLDPHDGHIRLGDCDMQDLTAPQWRRRIGFLPSENHWWYDTVSQHFTNPPAIHSLGLSAELLSHPVSRLSTGERQRFALLRLLAQEPHALLLDEPTANLDKQSQQQMERLILDYVKEKQAATLWVTHSEQQAQRVGKRLVLLEKG